MEVVGTDDGRKERVEDEAVLHEAQEAVSDVIDEDMTDEAFREISRYDTSVEVKVLVSDCWLKTISYISLLGSFHTLQWHLPLESVCTL